jgi:hypothetical protein
MNEPTEHQDHQISQFSQHKFIVLITGSIIISLFLVAISMALYASNGAAQLDRSRPGYKGALKKDNDDAPFKGFAQSGPIDAAALSEFKAMYDRQAKNATAVDAFNPSVLEDQALGIDAPASNQ